MRLILISILFLFTACTTADIEPIDSAVTTINHHKVKSESARQFCGNSEIVYYYEASTFYAFRCEDGRYFNLRK